MLLCCSLCGDDKVGHDFVEFSASLAPTLTYLHSLLSLLMLMMIDGNFNLKYGYFCVVLYFWVKSNNKLPSTATSQQFLSGKLPRLR